MFSGWCGLKQARCSIGLSRLVRRKNCITLICRFVVSCRTLGVEPFSKPRKSTCQSQSQEVKCLQLRVEKVIHLEGTWDRMLVLEDDSFFLDKSHSLPIVSTLPNPPSTVFEARIDPSASIPRVTINKAGLSNKLSCVYLRPLVKTVLRLRRPFPRITTHLRRGESPYMAVVGTAL